MCVHVYIFICKVGNMQFRLNVKFVPNENA